ncbi:MAG: hypothetical protein KA354_17305 [Phycisphaerae bacterium]|nr:hypothetical protein [Phycisphaerae bacterium]
MITVHLVFNAHIDPVWLWPWQSGLDTLLATCRSACDRLDAHPDLHFVRGEAWAYREVERIDPALFERIRAHVKGGRWHIVGGWWLQPDCNGPSAAGFEQQIALGKEFFLDRFGQFPREAYNVDSFGHAATLPAFMRAAGQDRYVFMRPQRQEMALPARLFRWRGDADSPEIIAFRVARAYTVREITVEHVRASLEGLPTGIDHTMCFVGIGDHGGGATEQQIAWCREHQTAIEGCRLVFSAPNLFFDAVADQTDKLPQVVGELQHHSIGCYSVHRAVKLGVHKAERRLAQAGVVRKLDPHPEPQVDERLKEAWRWVCFGHFHDIYGGTCIPSAYEQVHAQLGFAQAVADETLQRGLRRIGTTLPDDRMQRIVLLNASDAPFEGYVTHEPFLEGSAWQPHWRLIDEAGQLVPHQRVATECLVPNDPAYFLRMVFRLTFKPGQMRTLRIDPEGGLATTPANYSGTKVMGERITNDRGVSVNLIADDELTFEDRTELPLPKLQLISDPTDTWSHNIDRYSSDVLAKPHWHESQIVDAGPVMASLVADGHVADSRLLSEFRVYAGEPFVEWLLRVHWCERRKLLKLNFPLLDTIRKRYDGIPGGEIVRLPDGKERPVRDRTLIEMSDGRKLGLVFPEVFALDATPNLLRLTLLRSPIMAHHAPHNGQDLRAVYADQGIHEFRFRFFCGPDVNSELLDAHAMMMHRPPLAADLTRGMGVA